MDDEEANIYGSSADICVIGEATVRLGRRLVEDLREVFNRTPPESTGDWYKLFRACKISTSS